MSSHLLPKNSVHISACGHLNSMYKLGITLKNAVIWDVTPCRSCVNRRFGGTPVLARSIRRHIPEDGILHSHHRENLKAYKRNYIIYAVAQLVEALCYKPEGRGVESR
jgi:hypothetical protein